MIRISLSLSLSLTRCNMRRQLMLTLLLLLCCMQLIEGRHHQQQHDHDRDDDDDDDLGSRQPAEANALSRINALRIRSKRIKLAGRGLSLLVPQFSMHAHSASGQELAARLLCKFCLQFVNSLWHAACSMLQIPHRQSQLGTTRRWLIRQVHLAIPAHPASLSLCVCLLAI